MSSYRNEKHKQQIRDWQSLHTKQRIKARTEHIYGPGSTEYYKQQELNQKGLCAICEKSSKRKLYKDHDHKCCTWLYTRGGRQKLRACGKCVRGLLCNRCNGLLAGLEDVNFRVKAEAYLKKFTTKFGN